METLWSLEDKWKLSTHKAIAIFACTSFLLVGVCVAAGAWRRRRRRRRDKETASDGNGCAVKVLLGSVRWSSRRSEREGATALLVKREVVGGQSHNSTSAVWQRPILMGEKCELPRFSGLILYDQRGFPLHQYHDQGILYNQEMMASPGTTLRELML